MSLHESKCLMGVISEGYAVFRVKCLMKADTTSRRAWMKLCRKSRQDLVVVVTSEAAIGVRSTSRSTVVVSTSNLVHRWFRYARCSKAPLGDAYGDNDSLNRS